MNEEDFARLAEAITASQPTQYVTPSYTPGPGFQPGNINLLNRPAVQHPRGGVSSVRSLGVDFGQGEVLIPTVSEDSRIMSDQEARQEYLRSGRHLGKFGTPEAGTAYAHTLHEDQAALPPHIQLPQNDPNEDLREFLRFLRSQQILQR